MKKILRILLTTVVTQQLIMADNPNTVIGTVVDNPPTLNNPNYLFISPTQSLAYIPNITNNTVSILNTAENTITGIVTDIGTFSSPTHGTFSPDGQTAYVTNSGNNVVSIINVANNTVIGTIDATVHAFNNPTVMAFLPNVNIPTAYVLNTSNNISGSINIVQNNVVTGTVSGIPASRPISIAFTPDGTTAYVVDDFNWHIFKIDTTTNAVTQIITDANYLFSPQAIAIPNSTKAYVLNEGTNQSSNYTIAILDIATDTFTGIVSDPNNTIIYPSSIDITPDGKTAYVVNYEGIPNVYTGSVSIVNVATNTVTGTVTDLNPPTINYPWGSALTPDGKTLYVVNYTEQGGSISIISTDVAPDATLLPPATINAQRVAAIFLTQSNLINTITWTAPASGTAPISYNIYRDAALTQLIATVPANGPLVYADNNRQPNVPYTYYIVSVDAQGNVSAPISITIVG